MAIDEKTHEAATTATAAEEDRRTPGREALIRVAAAQTHPRIGHKEDNVRAAVELLRHAVDQRADLVVLPELGNSGYMFNSRAEAFALSEPIPDGPTCRAYLDVIRGTQLHVVAGICERDGTKLYNAAAVLGPDGFIGKYRKIHLWDEERLFFEPGNLGFPVFHLPFGRVGVMICFDGWFPESARILKLQGADIICDPTCWVLVPGLVEATNPLSAYVHMAQAHMNNVFIVCADRCGIERGCTFIGNSCIAGPSGFIAGPASFAETDLLITDINLAAARYHHWTALADPLADRRTDVYGSRLGYTPPAQ
jgi:predicted amidohydrolase